MLLPPVGLSGRALPIHRVQASKSPSCSRVARRVQAASTAIEEAPAESQLHLVPAPHTHPVLSAVSGTRAWATQLWTGIRRGDGSSAASDVLDKASLVVDTAERAQEVPVSLPFVWLRFDLCLRVSARQPCQWALQKPPATWCPRMASTKWFQAAWMLAVG